MLMLALAALRTLPISRAPLVAENLALRQQLAVLHRRAPRPRLRARDRALWVILRRMWTGWQDVLVLVQRATVIGWHREGLRLYASTMIDHHAALTPKSWLGVGPAARSLFMTA